MKKEFEKRNIEVQALETREEGNAKKISGVIFYDSFSCDLGGFVEVIRKGAFTKTLQESNVRCLWSHNTQYVLGTVKSGTFHLRDGEQGLEFEVDIPNTTWANDLYESIKRKDIPGVSFGFRCIKDAWTEQGEGKPALRELLEVALSEVSIGVAFQAYPEANADVSMRSLFKEKGIDLEKLAGLITRSKNPDYKVNEADVEMVNSTVSALNDMLPKEARQEEAEEEQPSEEPTVQEQPKDKFTVRSRELDLLELALKNLK